MSPATGARETAASLLAAVARHLSAWRLYAEGHPARESALDEVMAALDRLLEADPEPVFSFLSGRVVYGERPLRRMEGWPWAERLAGVGVQRLELSPGVERGEMAAFLDRLAGAVEGGGSLLAGEAAPGEVEAAAPEPTTQAADPFPHIRFGRLGLRGREMAGERPTGEGVARLEEEAETLGWIHEMAHAEGRVPVAEAVTVVESLSVALHRARQIIVPFLRLRQADRYTAGHCINVSILAMALAEETGGSSSEVRGAGTAGLLHDVGKAAVPPEILNKPGSLGPEERAVVENHTVEGARILLRSGEEMALPATVAYEHHLGPEARGYPTIHYARTPLEMSRLVQVCDFYDALRTRRHYRAPLPAPKVAAMLERASGELLDPEFARPFLALIERWDPSELLTEGEIGAGGDGAGSGPDGGAAGVGRGTAGPGAGLETGPGRLPGAAALPPDDDVSAAF